MNAHINKFYSQFSDETPDGKFHRVIALHEAPDVDWAILHNQFPMLSKGWYELTLVSSTDRIEFTRDYWLSKLPYHAQLSDFLVRFFEQMDDVGIYIYQHTFDQPYQVDIVYSLKNNYGFYRGAAAASDAQIAVAKNKLAEFVLPSDYVAFLQIHNGFCKTTDCTGLMSVEQLVRNYQQFLQDYGQGQQLLTTAKGVSVNPKKLLPFYESFGMPFYQCFWADWYPQNEMGNVYFSGNTSEISDAFGNDASIECMAFPTFLDWLMFYLERID